MLLGHLTGSLLDHTPLFLEAWAQSYASQKALRNNGRPKNQHKGRAKEQMGEQQSRIWMVHMEQLMKADSKKTFPLVESVRHHLRAHLLLSHHHPSSNHGGLRPVERLPKRLSWGSTRWKRARWAGPGRGRGTGGRHEAAGETLRDGMDQSADDLKAPSFVCFLRRQILLCEQG